jgi:hypothetical protein
MRGKGQGASGKTMEAWEVNAPVAGEALIHGTERISMIRIQVEGMKGSILIIGEMWLACATGPTLVHSHAERSETAPGRMIDMKGPQHCKRGARLHLRLMCLTVQLIEYREAVAELNLLTRLKAEKDRCRLARALILIKSYCVIVTLILCNVLLHCVEQMKVYA